MMLEDAQPLTGNPTTRLNHLSNACKRHNVRLMLELMLVVGFVASLSCAIGLGMYLRRTCGDSGSHDLYLAPECIHALGGGPVSPGGGLDSAAPKQFPHCAQQLAAYGDTQHGAYWREVDLAIADAMQVFGFASSSGNSLSSEPHAGVSRRAEQQGLEGAHMTTLRRSVMGTACSATPLTHCNRTDARLAIQQHQVLSAGLPSTSPSSTSAAATAAAAAAEPMHIQSVPAPGGRQVVIFDIDETLLSNMEQILNPDVWPWDKWVAAAKAPPLLPVQRFYNALCSAGYLVALVTGRREKGRESTMANLAKAGYGRPCALQNAQGIALATHLNSACCYQALLMRVENDTRLASVYKPWARQQLLKDNSDLEIVALVGDQFSDLNGETSAPYAFKLPNPFCYIL